MPPVTPLHTHSDQGIEIGFAERRFHLDPRRALWWPKHRLLAVADIHFEKGRFFGQHGSLLPPHDTLDNLTRLHALIRHYEPETVICLGDSFHREEQSRDLHLAEQTLLLTLLREVPRWHWILGNHDPMESIPFPGELHREITLDGITFSHGDAALPNGPTVLGHFHPKDTLCLPGRRISGACFAWNTNRLILPAFGRYTGGLDLQHPELLKVVGATPCVGMIHGQTIGCYRKQP